MWYDVYVSPLAESEPRVGGRMKRGNRGTEGGDVLYANLIYYVAAQRLTIARTSMKSVASPT